MLVFKLRLSCRLFSFKCILCFRPLAFGIANMETPMGIADVAGQTWKRLQYKSTSPAKKCMGFQAYWMCILLFVHYYGLQFWFNETFIILTIEGHVLYLLRKCKPCKPAVLLVELVSSYTSHAHRAQVGIARQYVWPSLKCRLGLTDSLYSCRVAFPIEECASFSFHCAHMHVCR
jgi:hypothetical protein